MSQISTQNELVEQGWMADKEKRANVYFVKAKYEIDDEFYMSFDEIREFFSIVPLPFALST